MIYKSIADLSRDIAAGHATLPRGVDLIVGVPRSGLLAASILALYANCKVTDVHSFCTNAPLATGRTRKDGTAEHSMGYLQTAWDAKSIVVIDDSAWTGKSLNDARTMIETSGYKGKATYGAVYTSPTSSPLDFHFASTGFPRIFEWNLFHRDEAEHYCVDIDGVLCLDPSAEQNDDGPKYIDFLQAARPLAATSYRIGHLVTSRLEKYRPQTEQWLRDFGVKYGELHMLDLPSAEERRRLGAHGSHKAKVYRKLKDAVLFIESESEQAIEIARLSGKPVLDYGQHVLRTPSSLASLPRVLEKKSRGFAGRVKRKVKSWL